MPPGHTVSSLAGGWALDASRYVFHDRVTTATSFRSTVWSFDPEAVEVVAAVNDEDEMTVFDVAVSPDGAEMVLTGSAGEPIATGTFVVVPGGGPVRISELAGEAIEWLPDSRGFVLSSRLADPAGLWIFDREGEAVRLLVGAGETLGAPTLIGVSSDGEWALVHWREFVARESFPAGTSHYSLVSIETGAVEPVKAKSGDTAFVGPEFAAFSPDGSSVIYGYREADGEALVLATRPSAGGEEVVIEPDLLGLAGEPPSPDRLLYDGEPAATWGEEMIVLRARDWALLLPLG